MSSKVMSQSINLFTNPKSNVDSNSKTKSTSSDFTSVMDKSLKSTQSVSNNEDYKDKKEVKKTSDENVTQNVTNTTNVSFQKDIKNMSSDNEDATANVTDSTETDEVLNESVLEKVKELFSEIQNKLMKGLNLTKEELEKQLELLGLTMFDMLNMDNLKQLILNVNGSSDITDVLTNETLASTLQSLTSSMEEIVQENELNISTTEFNEVVKQAMDDAAIEMDDYEIKDNSSEDVPDVKGPEVQVFVEKEVSSNANNSQSSKEETNTSKENNNILDTIMNNLAGVNNENPLNLTEAMTKVSEIREIVNQIVEQIKILIKPDQTSMEMQLNPENLGKLQLSVVSKDGVLTAQFTTSNQAVKEVIESQMGFLKENLTNQGLKVEAIEVTVSNFEFSGSNEAQNDNNNQGNSKKRRFLYDDVTEANNVSEEPVAMNELNEQNGTTVDYSA
jgi:flagellar hook-length control protein FliK